MALQFLRLALPQNRVGGLAISECIHMSIITGIESFFGEITMHAQIRR